MKRRYEAVHQESKRKDGWAVVDMRSRYRESVAENLTEERAKWLEGYLNGPEKKPHVLRR